MKTKPYCLPLLVVIALFLASCSDPNAARKQVLGSELKEADSQYALLSQTVSSRRSDLVKLEQGLSEQRAKLGEYKGRVLAYMMDHKMATAAIVAGVGGAAVAWDPKNEFSEEAKEIGTVGAVVAAIWALANLEEVTQVAGELAKADVNRKSLEGQINSTSDSYKAESDQLSQEEPALEMARQKCAQTRSELNALR